jgi:SPP1 gp7 family putative phage head morphogenesis protein
MRFGVEAKGGRLSIGRFQEEAKPPEGEVGIARSSVLGSKDLVRWNPDTLIGRKGYQIYQKMLQDDQIKGLVHFLRHATIARGFEFVIDEDSPEAQQQEDFVEFIENMLADALRGTWIDRLLDLQSAHDWGFAMLEKIIAPWEWNGKTWWALTDAKLRFAPSFYFSTDKHGNVTGVEQDLSGVREDIDIERFVHFVNRPDEDPQYGRSDLRETYRAWWSKDNTIKFRAMYLERMAGGFAYIQEEGKGMNPNDRTAVDSMLNELQARSAFRLPVGAKFQVNFPEDTDQFEKTIESDNKAMARSMLVPPLLGISEQGSVGAFAQSKTQFEAFMFTLDARATRLADAVSEQLWRDLNTWNFGLSTLPIYRPKPMTEAMRREIAGAWADAVQKGAGTNDLQTEQHTRELLGYPARSEEEVEVGIRTRPPTPTPPETPSAGGSFQERPWANRVDFAEMDRGSSEIIGATFKATGEAMNTAWESMRATIVRRKLGTKAQDPGAIASLQFPKKALAAYRRAITQGMKGGVKFGRAQAASELPSQAELAEFAARIPAPGMDDQLMEEFLRGRGFESTRDISQDLLKKVQAELFNGIKYDKTTAEMIASIEPLIEDLIPAVDSAGRTVNKAARLQTIVRTQVWEAINESRMSFFTDPDLDGFVQALEYTAILDDRTTDICQHLDGRVYPANSPVWDGRRPPNHFNCRSLLIPVTALEEWKKSPNPSSTITPHEGFM